MKVKQLEWSETSYGRPEVETIVGTYRIFKHVSGGWGATRRPFNLVDEFGRQNFATIEEAKAAAQSDYERRILSALEW